MNSKQRTLDEHYSSSKGNHISYDEKKNLIQVINNDQRLRDFSLPTYKTYSTNELLNENT